MFVLNSCISGRSKPSSFNQQELKQEELYSNRYRVVSCCADVSNVSRISIRYDEYSDQNQRERAIKPVFMKLAGAKLTTTDKEHYKST